MSTQQILKFVDGHIERDDNDDDDGYNSQREIPLLNMQFPWKHIHFRATVIENNYLNTFELWSVATFHQVQNKSGKINEPKTSKKANNEIQ